MAKIDSLKDLLMLLFYAKGATDQIYEPVRGRTRVMKMVFLFKEEILMQFNRRKVLDPSILPDFVPYNYGPFAREVFADLEYLTSYGLVECTNVGSPLEEESEEYEHWIIDEGVLDSTGDQSSISSAITEQEYRISRLGIEFVESELLVHLSSVQIDLLNEFKKRCTSVPLRTLLRYVYSRYPEMTTESKIRDKIMSEYRF